MYASLRVVTVMILDAATPVSAFEMRFDWGKLVLCTSGRPNTVSSPTFTLNDVPDGTRFIRFRLVDRDAPGYPHGGGTVPFAGDRVIAPGAFTYKSPCPPSGRHTYEWSATAMNRRDGGELGVATAAQLYP